MDSSIIRIKFTTPRPPLELATDLALLDSHLNQTNHTNLVESVLNYIYNVTLARRKFPDIPLPNLKNRNLFECEVEFQSIKIGTISLVSHGEHKFYNVTYTPSIPHVTHIHEYHPDDVKYHVTTLQSKHVGVTLELGYQHPSRDSNVYINRQAPDQHPLEQPVNLSYSFNGIVMSETLNYLLLFEPPQSVRTEPANFLDYYVKEATFEDAVKSLLLVHLIATQNTGDYKPLYEKIITQSMGEQQRQTIDETDEEDESSDTYDDGINNTQILTPSRLGSLAIGIFVGITIAGMYCKSRFQ